MYLNCGKVYPCRSFFLLFFIRMDRERLLARYGVYFRGIKNKKPEKNVIFANYILRRIYGQQER